MLGRFEGRTSRSAATVFLASVLVAGAVSCGTARKLTDIRSRELSASINLRESSVPEPSVTEGGIPVQRDTITVKIDGHDMVVMKAVRDEQTGEMVATDRIDAAVITARFRNVAERHGKVDIQFEIKVPSEMYDSRWQLRLAPEMVLLGDSIGLDRVIVTGEDYRKAQLRGYQQYERFLSRIIADSGHFIDVRSFEIFLQRNIPQVYAFKSDSSLVSDECFESRFGVTDRQALEHYTDRIGVYLNERRKSMKSAMFSRYVKSPIVSSGIRLDTVIRTLDGDFSYLYTETIDAAPEVRKVEVSMSGEIYNQDKRLYSIPESVPLTYYISSLSTLVDGRERYLTEVIERSVEANATWNIDFEQGRSTVTPSLGDNAICISNIRRALEDLVTDDKFDLDSITIAAFASPEGSVKFNGALCAARAESVAGLFRGYVRHLRDSVRREEGFFISMDGSVSTRESGGMMAAAIPMRASSSGENWSLLDHLVKMDTVLSPAQKAKYSSMSLCADPDVRERRLQDEDFYRHLKDDLYPMLRTVQFNFFLHRKGMVKDTVHTTVLDSTYMRGLQAIRDRNYEEAASLLMPYNDFNSAVAYLCLDRNMSAKAILETLPRTAPVNYMLAVLYSRMGDDEEAVQCFLNSCSQDRSYVYRGNLDPEISALIKKYNLNSYEENEWTD